MTLFVDSVGDEFLARTSLAKNQDVDIGVGDTSNRVIDGPHGRAAADKGVEYVVH